MVEVLACVGVELGVAPSQELSFGGVPLQMREMTTVMDLGMEDGAVLRLGGDHSQELLHQVVAGVKAALRTRTAALEREAKWRSNEFSLQRPAAGQAVMAANRFQSVGAQAREAKERAAAEARQKVTAPPSGACGGGVTPSPGHGGGHEAAKGWSSRETVVPRKSGGLGGKRQGDEKPPSCTAGCMIM